MRPDSHELLRKLWHDPVWSKVIATLIAAVVLALATWVVSSEVREPWLIGSVVTAATILLCALFILFRQARRIITPWEVHRRPYYRASIRRIAFFGAIIAPVLPVAIWSFSALHQRFSADTILILVADFETRPTDASYRVTRTIVQQLQEVTSSFKDVHVLRLGRPILWHDGIQTALRLGAERRATVVIWGDFDTTPDAVIVSTNLELIPRPGLRHRRGWNTSTDKLSELHHFTLQQKLSSEITYTTLFILGLIHYNTGDAAGSIGPLTKALERSVTDRNPKDILFTRGRAFFELGRYEDALADFERVIAIEPTYDHVLNNRGVTHLLLGAYEQGVSDLTAAIALKPCDTLAYRNRSSAYYDLRKLDLAIADASTAVACNPEDSGAYILQVMHVTGRGILTVHCQIMESH